MKEGDKAPDFCLNGIDENGKEGQYCLADILRRGQNVILYFYPKDGTSGCTQEACDFRDNLNRLTNKGIVIGVSKDSIESHKNFRETNKINFLLLSDPDHKILETYGAWGEQIKYGIAKPVTGTIRTTFLIGKDSKIKKIWQDVNVKGHVDEVIGAISA